MTLLWKHLPWLSVLCHIAPTKIRRRYTLLREFCKITTVSDLPIQQDFQQLVNQLRSRKPAQRFASLLIDMEFSPTTSWATFWNGFDGRKKFLVSDQTNAVGAISLHWGCYVVRTKLDRFRT